MPLGPGNLDLAVDLTAFPLALVDRVAGNRGLRGTVTGTRPRDRAAGRPGGRLRPARRGHRRGGPATTNGIPPLNLTAAGSYRAQALTLNAPASPAPAAST